MLFITILAIIFLSLRFPRNSSISLLLTLHIIASSTEAQLALSKISILKCMGALKQCPKNAASMNPFKIVDYLSIYHTNRRTPEFMNQRVNLL